MGIRFFSAWQYFSCGVRGMRIATTSDIGHWSRNDRLFLLCSFFSTLLQSLLWRPLSPVCALGTVSLRLSHGAALTCHRHVIHYRAAAAPP